MAKEEQGHHYPKSFQGKTYEKVAFSSIGRPPRPPSEDEKAKEEGLFLALPQRTFTKGFWVCHRYNDLILKGVARQKASREQDLEKDVDRKTGAQGIDKILRDFHNKIGMCRI